jgi:hypothetical protein
MVTREANDTIKSWAFSGIGKPVVVSYPNVYVFSRCCGRDPDAWQHNHASPMAETFSNSLFLSFLVVLWMLLLSNTRRRLGMYSARRRETDDTPV